MGLWDTEGGALRMEQGARLPCACAAAARALLRTGQAASPVLPAVLHGSAVNSGMPQTHTCVGTKALD